MTAAPVLSDREQAVLDAITASVRERGYPPTLQEICDVVGLASRGSVHQVLQKLEIKGVIRRNPGPRAITVTHLMAAS